MDNLKNVSNMHIIIFAGGTVQSGSAVSTAIATAEIVIAADSGAATALQYGCIPALVVGDFDSLDPAVLQQLIVYGSEIRRVTAEKDETDTELAILAAIERGATTITLLGWSGGMRFEHTIANLLLLADITTVPIRIADSDSTGWLLRGPVRERLAGQVGDLLSLLPLTGAATGVRTAGLYYPLQGETLHFGKPRGISNVFTQETAEVFLQEGLLLLIHTQTNSHG
ncbi:MAG TPA: thiamine diphosphokinase [Ktedonobacteraceae bacterium]|nr:thiamine diphosphokinase [Ktedonobacteraceae bacterium]